MFPRTLRRFARTCLAQQRRAASLRPQDGPFPIRVRRCLASLVWGTAALLATFAAAQNPQPRLPAPGTDPYSVDRHLIVECLLPGAMRKLSSSVTYAMPPKVAMLRAFECETRGGEYVLYDQADPAAALRLWSKVAAGGDAEAMNRVGQLHELGAGRAPDHAEALKWYLKAAQAGSRKAALNLASLYERGLGVQRDPVKALEWYRRATGAGDLQLDGVEVRKLRDEIDRLERRIRELEEKAREGEAAQRASEAAQRTSEAALRASEAAWRASEAAWRAELKTLQAQRDAVQSRLQQAGGPILAHADTGEAASQRPTIVLLDPTVIRTRGERAVPLGDELPSKALFGRVQAPRGVSEVRVNASRVAVDRYGFFQANVRLRSGENRVHIVAEDRTGARDELLLTLVNATPAAAKSLPRPAPPPLEVRALRTGRPQALVVGNNDYADRDLIKLGFAVSDAQALERVLRERYGFETKLLINATYVQFLDALNEYVERLGENDPFLLYYAGHGEIERFAGTVGFRGNWLPVDASARSNALWIANPKITDLLAKMRSKKVMVIADACYSGTLATQGAIPTIVPGAREDARLAVAKEYMRIPSRTVLTSGALQQTPDSDANGRPLNFFGRALVEVLNENDGVLDGYTLFQEVQPRVTRAVREDPALRAYRFEQIPLYAALAHAGHEGGDFVFVPRQY